MAHVLAEGPSRGERAELDGDQPPAGVLADPDLADAGVHGHLLVAVGGAVALDLPDDGGVAGVAVAPRGRGVGPVGAAAPPGGSRVGGAEGPGPVDPLVLGGEEAGGAVGRE